MDNTKNTAIDLHNILFEQLERLNDNDVTKEPEDLERELQKTKGMCDIAEQIMGLASLQLEAARLVNDNEIYKENVPRLLTSR